MSNWILIIIVVYLSEGVAITKQEGFTRAGCQQAAAAVETTTGRPTAYTKVAAACVEQK